MKPPRKTDEAEREKARFMEGLSQCSAREKSAPTDEFLDRMRALGRKAQERGMTPDTLEVILNTPDTHSP